MDSEGEMYHQPDGKKAAVEEEGSMARLKEDVLEIEMEVDAEVPQAESAEINSPRKMIRGESEETQDYVCETLSISQEETEEECYQRATRHRTKTTRYWQLASVVVEEGKEARTVNLCQQCYKERQVQQGP